MLMIPLPWFILEIVIFFLAVQQWGFLNTLGLYLLPCLLGFFIVSTVGRLALVTLQSTVMRGQLPGTAILHSGAIFLAGLLFLVPSFFTRVIGVILILPGLRHLAIWRFKLYLAQQIAKGSARFNFSGPFGFGSRNGAGGFRYYQYRGDGKGFQKTEDPDSAGEREVFESNVLDVTPLKVTHEEKKKED